MEISVLLLQIILVACFLFTSELHAKWRFLLLIDTVSIFTLVLRLVLQANELWEE
jgi:hypothetical protein